MSIPAGKLPNRCVIAHPRGGSTIKKDLNDAADAAEKASNSRVFVAIARAGFAVSGVLHVLIGIIAIQLAFGESKDADKGGAMSQLSAQPAGSVLLWVGAAACLALGLWQLSEVVFGYRELEKKKKLGRKLSAAGQGAVFFALAFWFASYAVGNRKESSESSSGTSAKIMEMPGGSVILLLVGAGIAVTGVVFVVRGFMRSFAKVLGLPAAKSLRRGILVLGAVGYVAKGVSLALVGILVIVATLQSDPEKSTGLDGALKAVREQPYGVYLLTAVGIGLGCYGLYMIAKSRFVEMK